MVAIFTGVMLSAWRSDDERHGRLDASRSPLRLQCRLFRAPRRWSGNALFHRRRARSDSGSLPAAPEEAFRPVAVRRRAPAWIGHVCRKPSRSASAWKQRRGQGRPVFCLGRRQRRYRAANSVPTWVVDPSWSRLGVGPLGGAMVLAWRQPAARGRGDLRWRRGDRRGPAFLCSALADGAASSHAEIMWRLACGSPPRCSVCHC